jgi:hypothetical protein
MRRAAPEHYAWRSVRRTGRQFGMVAIVVGIGFSSWVVSFLVFGAGE